MSSPSRLSRPIGFRQSAAALTLSVGLSLTVGAAWLFQIVGGYIPCALCLQQRIPYYVGIPVALLTLVLAAGRANALAVRLLLLALAAIMLWSLGLAVYHAGVEWQFWAGPTGCATGGGAITAGGNLLDEIDRVRAPSCDDAAGRFLGLSFAGWNAVASAVFAAVALRAVFARADRFAR